MKTPEQAMRGFVRCFSPLVEIRCAFCPYRDMKDCQKAMTQDVYNHIQQLESTVSQVSKALCGKENATLDELLQAVDQMKSRLAQVERERDALAYEARGCSSCAHRECDPDEPPCNACVQDGSGYEWRGLCPENTKEV